MKSPVDISVSLIALVLFGISALALVRGNPARGWISFALSMLILVPWSLYSLFRAAPDIYRRRPRSITILLLVSGVYVIACVAFVYLYSTMRDPPNLMTFIPLNGPPLMGIVGFLYKRWTPNSNDTGSPGNAVSGSESRL